MKAESVIRATDLHKSFRRGPEVIHVLKGLNLEVSAGEGVAVIGASGTGKSTLLHLLGGLERPDQGQIFYDDADICTMRAADLTLLRNRKLGFVFQFHFLLPEFTALENVMIPALVGTWNKYSARTRALELLDLVGLNERVEHKPGELSGGEQQRVAVARALMMSPAVLLADEPTGDLDPETGGMMQELLVKLKSALRVTMIIATHNHTLAHAMDRVLVLKGGVLEAFAA
jgi:lipoprotein-releasing system ATP-binding protein